MTLGIQGVVAEILSGVSATLQCPDEVFFANEVTFPGVLLLVVVGFGVENLVCFIFLGFFREATYFVSPLS